ncbi:MAG: GNAT family N-acetyltransferase [Candidatus Heimdallarchaeaceae archaeon]
MTEFIPLDLEIHREELIKLNIEYMSWIFDEIERNLKVNTRTEIGPVDEYIRSKIDEIYSFSPPKGICFLIKEDTLYAGMGAFREIREGVAEIKRMYVKPEYRGRGLGKQLIVLLLQKIEEYQFSEIYLDTAPFMEAAHGLYKKMGFVDRDAFPETEVPEAFRHLWNYMEKKV